jgi:hypothetical protein
MRNENTIKEIKKLIPGLNTDNFDLSLLKKKRPQPYLKLLLSLI